MKCRYYERGITQVSCVNPAVTPRNYKCPFGKEVECDLNLHLRNLEEVCDRESVEYLQKLCSYCYTTEIWCILHKAGGAYRFTELRRFVGCSPTTLSNSLSLLLSDDLVKMVNEKYQAVYPPWMQNGTRKTHD